MNIYIGENIRRMRNEKGLTQEEFADYIGVSFQAVSKWERSLAYPDIETLIVIANFFDISIDDLMGNSRIRTEEKISEYLKEYDRLALISTEGANCEKNDLARKAYAEIPYDWRIINMYRHSLLCGRDAEDFGDTKPTIRFLCEKILADCTNDHFRQCAVSSLLETSETKEEEDKWLALLNDDFCLLQGERREDIAFSRRRFEEALKHCQTNLQEYLSWFLMKVETLTYYGAIPGDLRMLPEQRIRVNDKVIGILRLLFENEDFGEWTWQIACKFEANARDYFRLGRLEEGVAAFEQAVEYWLRYDALPEITAYTSVLFDRSEFVRIEGDTADTAYKKPKRLLESIRSDSVYDPVRDDMRFLAAVNRLEKAVI